MDASTRRKVQLGAAAAALVVAGIFAYTEKWVFATTPTKLNEIAKPSLAQLVLSDRATLGFVRFGIVLLALYAIASVPALIAGGRWLKGFGTSGLTADDALAEGADTIANLKQVIEELKAQRDEAVEIAQRSLRS
jgi:hypothetical protein